MRSVNDGMFVTENQHSSSKSVNPVRREQASQLSTLSYLFVRRPRDGAHSDNSIAYPRPINSGTPYQLRVDAFWSFS